MKSSSRYPMAKLVCEKLESKWLATFSVILMLAIITACGDNDKKEPAINGSSNHSSSVLEPSSQFEAYLKLKHINPRDDKHRQSLFTQFQEREQFASVIEKEGLLNKEMIAAEINEFRKEMLISRYFDKFLRDKVNSSAVHNYYISNASDYEERSVHVAHVLLRTDKKMGEPERKAKLTTAHEAYSKIKAGVEFSKVAKDFSEDTISGKKGGDLGWLKQGAIDARFSKAVFSMKPGEVSLPFETAFGFHVVTLIEGPKLVKKPFDAVKGDIRYQLRNQAKDAELQRLSMNMQSGN